MAEPDMRAFWEEDVENGMRRMLDYYGCHLDRCHIEDTPKRFVASLKEYFAGADGKPDDILKVKFKDEFDEMVYVNNINFVSFCAHHLVPFIGKAHFAYIPRKGIVGLSKIPRLVELFAKRPQVQENLTQDIVDSFQRIVRPKGCAVVVEAIHFCMVIRGVKKEQAYTKTTALRGIFKGNPVVRAEFLDGIRQNGANIWP